MSRIVSLQVLAFSVSKRRISRSITGADSLLVVLCRSNVAKSLSVPTHRSPPYLDVEYIYGFVWWGVCKQSRWRHSVTEPSEETDMCYYGNVMITTRWWLCVIILHLQQYSHRLNFLYIFYTQQPLKHVNLILSKLSFWRDVKTGTALKELYASI